MMMTSPRGEDLRRALSNKDRMDLKVSSGLISSMARRIYLDSVKNMSGIEKCSNK